MKPPSFRRNFFAESGFALATLLVAGLLSGCRGGKEELAAAKVMGFRFATGDRENFTLIKEGGKIDFDALGRLKVREAKLTEPQVEILTEAVYGENPKYSSAACYDPHHLFVFYDAEGKVVKAIEVCFGCTSIHTVPELGEANWGKHDFRAIARLCDEIGIGMVSGTAEDFVKHFDWQESL